MIVHMHGEVNDKQMDIILKKANAYICNSVYYAYAAYVYRNGLDTYVYCILVININLMSL